MYKLLIVDDEEIILEGLKRNIPWEAHDFRIVGEAANGEKALALVEKLQPDIVISDVRMPVVDGLALVEKLGRDYPGIKTVLLTGYDHFEYAKRALNLKVTDYVLKYNYKEEMLAAVIRARDELEAEARLKEQAKRGQDLMQHRIIRDLIRGRSGDLRDDGGRNGSDPGFVGSWFAVAAVSFREPGTANDDAGIFDLDELALMIQAEFDKTAGDPEQWVFCAELHPNVAVCFNRDGSPEDEVRTGRSLETVLHAVAGLCRLRVWAGIGGWEEGTASLKKSYDEALTALEVNRILNRRTVLRFADLSGNESSSQAVLKKIIDYIEQNYSRKELSLNSISKAVFISPAYISTLFKKGMGINLSEYIIKIRLEKAAALLKQTDLKTYEIAEKIGYTSAQYFSVLFKKYIGYSPTEYKTKGVTGCSGESSS